MPQVEAYRSETVVETVQRSKGLLLIHFGSPLASFSHYVSVEFRVLAEEFDGRVSFAEVNVVPDAYSVIQAYQIENLPLQILFSDGNPVERLEMPLPLSELRNFVEAAVSYHGPGFDDDRSGG